MTRTPNRTLVQYLSGGIDLANDTLRVALFDNSTGYTFDEENHEFVDDILDGGTTAQELQGSSGYTGTTDRKTIQNTSVVKETVSDTADFDGDDVVWNNVDATEDIQGWIVYKQVGGDDSTPGDDPVIMVVDDSLKDAPGGLPLPVSGSDVAIRWDDPIQDLTEV